MAIRVIDDTKLNNIAVAIQAKDSGGQMTVDEMPNRIDALPTGGTLIPKTITENGVYNASSDNADGYSEVSVNVPDDFDRFLSDEIDYVKTDAITVIPMSYLGSTNVYFNNLVFWSSKNATSMPWRTFSLISKMLYANIGKVSTIGNYSFSYNYGIKTLIITAESVPIIGTYTFSRFSESGVIYVFDSLKTSYQTATNWGLVRLQIKGFSEAPTYDSNTTYEIGDVCKYNGKFYGYCKQDLTSSTGNPPTGTTSDNIYWEYVADIEVI